MLDRKTAPSLPSSSAAADHRLPACASARPGEESREGVHRQSRARPREGGTRMPKAQRTSPRRVLEQLRVYCLPGQLDVAHDAAADERILHRRLQSPVRSSVSPRVPPWWTRPQLGGKEETHHVRVPLEVEHADRVEADVEELVDRLERAGDAEVVLELDGDLCGRGWRRKGGRRSARGRRRRTAG